MMMVAITSTSTPDNIREGSDSPGPERTPLMPPQIRPRSAVTVLDEITVPCEIAGPYEVTVL